MNTTTENKVEISFCNIDRLHYIYSNDEAIHHQQTKPTDEDIKQALISDEWENRFKDMRQGKEIRVSARIWDSMLGSVPPLKFTGESFFNGECFSGASYYYFEMRNGLRYGSIRNIKTKELMNNEMVKNIKSVYQD